MAMPRWCFVIADPSPGHRTGADYQAARERMSATKEVRKVTRSKELHLMRIDVWRGQHSRIPQGA